MFYILCACELKRIPWCSNKLFWFMVSMTPPPFTNKLNERRWSVFLNLFALKSSWAYINCTEGCTKFLKYNSVKRKFSTVLCTSMNYAVCLCIWKKKKRYFPWLLIVIAEMGFSNMLCIFQSIYRGYIHSERFGEVKNGFWSIKIHFWIGKKKKRILKQQNQFL